MKTGLFVAAMVQLASAQPHANLHARMHDKRVEYIHTVTQVHTVTATNYNAVIFVDQQGRPYSTSYCAESGPQPTPQTFTSVVPQAAPTPAAPAGGHHAHHGHHAQPAAQPAAGGSSGHAHGGHHSNSGKSGLAALQSSIGMVYSPYVPEGGACKSDDNIKSDLSQLNEYDYLRIYSTECPSAINIAKSMGFRLFLGVFDLSDVAGDISSMANVLNHNWDQVDAVNIGNELVNSGSNSAEEVASAVNDARSQLSGLGYNGPVVTVDTFQALQDNPQLCDASDFAAANAHAFYDPTIDASQAGAWAKGTQSDVAQACNKPCIITESGWPHQGTANGKAIPSPAAQAQAISSLKGAFSKGGIILFTAFDDMWKTDTAYTFGAEKYWGILAGQ